MTPTLKSNNKCIGITLGDPSGIGPQVVSKALRKSSITKKAQFIIIGDSSSFKKYFPKKIKNCNFLPVSSVTSSPFKAGKPNIESAKASIHYLDESLQLLKKKKINALVTGPVSKEGIDLFNPQFRGHTEYLAKAFKIKNVEMMFVAKKMKTIILTRHIPLSKVSQFITQKNIFKTIEIAHQYLKTYFKKKNPKIAVCGLNPHAGEGGNIGQEEIKYIIPAIKKAKFKKISVEGPFAADTLFCPDQASTYDCIISMYHDQGLTPMKALYFKEVVNLTLGLPFVRTSPSHGTAFNIAHTKKANPRSMEEAINLAIDLSL